ncbi:MAG: sigma-70 family RNA polymerase sigma factor [Gemmatimonadetes bacterium]|nr:sigma-70 family RNA polymerase sigma factor [Gemmatimonadota bacterium]
MGSPGCLGSAGVAVGRGAPPWVSGVEATLVSDPRTPAGGSESDDARPGAQDAGDQSQSSGPTNRNGLDRSEPARPIREVDIAAFRRGEGFEAVLERFGSLIHSVAHRYAEDGDEEGDLYQEACLRIWQGRETFREGALSVWIFRTADRSCRNLVRARKLRQAANERYADANPDGVLPSGVAADPWKHMLGVEAMERIRRALDQLGGRLAHAYVLTEIEGYSAREAARIMGGKASTIRSLVRHAKRKLRDYLKEEE